MPEQLPEFVTPSIHRPPNTTLNAIIYAIQRSWLPFPPLLITLRSRALAIRDHTLYTTLFIIDGNRYSYNNHRRDTS